MLFVLLALGISGFAALSDPKANATVDFFIFAFIRKQEVD